MVREVRASTVALFFCALPVICQTSDRSVPIYRITVIQRSIPAINYQYRSLPTKIDFRGTVLQPKAKGEASVESRRGRTEIDAKFENLEEPQRFGGEYLTYVLWAVTPEGRPHNIGEIMPDGSNKAKLRVTTDLQAFGLIVTAEPYSAVRQPSDVVVLENKTRPDTVGKIEEIQARYELMPRGHYTLQAGAPKSSMANAPKVSMAQYEALSELYQAQNAIAIARTGYAEQYAPNTLAKAQQLLDEARRLQGFKGNASLVVQNAREAAQTAEDARVIAERRHVEEKLANAQAEASTAAHVKAEADAETQQARAEVDAARAQADVERAARQRAEADAAAARERAQQAEAEAQSNRGRAAGESQQQQHDLAARQKIEMRMRLLEQLNGVISMRDTPRGLVATITDAGFSGPVLHGTASSQLARVAAIVKAQPGLRVEVDGHTDSANTEALASRRAEAVRDVLIGYGLPAGAVTARGLGNTRPLVSNSAAPGRAENRRVEIVISGDPIGTLPFWDRAYTLSRR
jgi:outer membrane protein OmpA-like peptidoglycan-associated protein